MYVHKQPATESIQLINQKLETNKTKKNDIEHGNSTSQIIQNKHYFEHNKNINQQANGITVVPPISIILSENSLKEFYEQINNNHNKIVRQSWKIKHICIIF